MPVDLDLVVLGGGCAGLSLAERLAEQSGPCRRVAVLEPRSRYSNDRSWCFWRLGPHRHDALVRHRWSQIGVRSPSKTVRMDCAETPYQLLEASAFYDQARRAHVLVSEGDIVGGFTVIEVDEEHLIVSRDGRELVLVADPRAPQPAPGAVVDPYPRDAARSVFETGDDAAPTGSDDVCEGDGAAHGGRCGQRRERGVGAVEALAHSGARDVEVVAADADRQR